MKKLLFLILLIFTSLSHAQLRELFRAKEKPVKATEKPVKRECSEKRLDECNAKHEELRCGVFRQNDIEKSIKRRDVKGKVFRCWDFVKRCECWAKTTQKSAMSNWQDWETPGEVRHRTERFMAAKNALLPYGSAIEDAIAQKRIQERERAKQDSIRRMSIRKETEEQEQAMRDSIRQELFDEIYDLIENGAETSLILDKCDEYRKTFIRRTSMESTRIEIAKEVKSSVEEGIFTDPRDGKEYKIIVIGNQTWMSENLNYETSNSKCYNNQAVNCTQYGSLYDGVTATSVCPSDWHLPNNKEWQTLIDFAGGKEAAGKKLKAKNGWEENGNGIDEFGFTALPGGNSAFGNFRSVGSGGYWWSATAGMAMGSYSYFKLSDIANVEGRGSPQSDLYSVRCLQNDISNKNPIDEQIKKIAAGFDKSETQALIAESKRRGEENNRRINEQAEELIMEITALLKVNKLEECLDKCEQTGFNFDAHFSNTQKSSDLKFSGVHKFREPELFTQNLNDDNKEKITNLCGKQFVDKIKKLPQKNINSSSLAKIYFGGYEEVFGYIIQNDGKMILISDISFGTIMMVQHTGHIGNCRLSPNHQIPWRGNVKYLGEKTYIAVSGARQSVPNYQLLWCD